MKILKYGDARLTLQCEDISKITPQVKGWVLDMFDLMKKSNGIGLAAPQVGINKNIFIVDLYDGINKYVFINPRIIEESSEYFEFEEGCLSFPGLTTTVKRHEWIKVSALDLQGNNFEVTASDLLAVVIQHENDHLNGRLLSDTTLEPEQEFQLKLKTRGLI